MKKLLIVVLSLSVVTALADAKPQAMTKASPKVAAKEDGKKTGAKKADAKAAAPKAAKAKAAVKKATKFQAYDAGEWKPVDNRRGHLFGYQLTDSDLVHQPILVVKFDPDVEVDNDKRESDPRFVNQFLGWEVKVQPHLQVINVPCRPLEKDELPNLRKLAGSTAAIPGFPWYQDLGLVKEPENSGGAYPFYYVVSTDGKVIYAGNRGNEAKSYVYGDLKKSGEPDPLLGFVKPDIHSNVCANLAFGTDTSPVIAKLKPLAQKGAQESKDEAQAILDALEQSQTYWLKQVLGTMYGNPPLAFVMAGQAVKTFPRNKEYKAYVNQLKATAGAALPVFIKMSEIQEKLKVLDEKNETPKKADLKKWYQIACSAEKKCVAAKKSFGDKLPRSFVCLEDIVQTVKADLEAKGAGEK